MPPSVTGLRPAPKAAPPEPRSAEPRPAPAPRPGRRDRIRATPGLAQAYRAAVFVAGLACIGAGVALAVLPGPLTIPPVLLGLWIWAGEFAFAERLFCRFKDKAREAWAHARRHPASSAAMTAGGLLLAVAALWAAGHYDLVAQGRNAAGL